MFWKLHLLNSCWGEGERRRQPCKHQCSRVFCDGLLGAVNIQIGTSRWGHSSKLKLLVVLLPCMQMHSHIYLTKWKQVSGLTFNPLAKWKLTFAQDLHFLIFSGLYFPPFICESPSLKAQFIVEKLSSWMPCSLAKLSLESKVSIDELGEEGVTWMLAWTSCQLRSPTGIGEFLAGLLLGVAN